MTRPLSKQNMRWKLPNSGIWETWLNVCAFVKVIKLTQDLQKFRVQD